MAFLLDAIIFPVEPGEVLFIGVDPIKKVGAIFFSSLLRKPEAINSIKGAFTRPEIEVILKLAIQEVPYIIPRDSVIWESILNWYSPFVEVPALERGATSFGDPSAEPGEQQRYNTDGRSFSLPLLLAVCSLLMHRSVSHCFAATGEVDPQSGAIIPVRGLKEKFAVLEDFAPGVKYVLIARDQTVDFETTLVPVRVSCVSDLLPALNPDGTIASCKIKDLWISEWINEMVIESCYKSVVEYMLPVTNKSVVRPKALGIQLPIGKVTAAFGFLESNFSKGSPHFFKKIQETSAERLIAKVVSFLRHIQNLTEQLTTTINQIRRMVSGIFALAILSLCVIFFVFDYVRTKLSVQLIALYDLAQTTRNENTMNEAMRAKSLLETDPFPVMVTIFAVIVLSWLVVMKVLRTKLLIAQKTLDQVKVDLDQQKV